MRKWCRMIEKIEPCGMIQKQSVEFDTSDKFRRIRDMNKRGNNGGVFVALCECYHCCNRNCHLACLIYLDRRMSLLKSLGITLIPVLLIVFVYVNYTVFFKDSDEGELNQGIKKLQSLDKGARWSFSWNDYRKYGSYSTISKIKSFDRQDVTIKL